MILLVESQLSSTNPQTNQIAYSSHSALLVPSDRSCLFSNSLNQGCPVKLDIANFLLWQSMVLPIICRNKLEHHILDENSCPPKHLPEDAEKINPAFDEWVAVLIS